MKSLFVFICLISILNYCKHIEKNVLCFYKLVKIHIHIRIVTSRKIISIFLKFYSRLNVIELHLKLHYCFATFFRILYECVFFSRPTELLRTTSEVPPTK